jgi:hypothetical protein
MAEPPVSHLESHSPLPLPARQVSQLGLLAVLVWLVVRYLFGHRLSPPDWHRYGKKKSPSRRARSLRCSEWLPDGGHTGKKTIVETATSTGTRPRKTKMQRRITM